MQEHENNKWNTYNLRNNKMIVKKLGTKIEDLGSIRGTVLGIGKKYEH